MTNEERDRWIQQHDEWLRQHDDWLRRHEEAVAAHDNWLREHEQAHADHEQSFARHKEWLERHDAAIQTVTNLIGRLAEAETVLAERVNALIVTVEKFISGRNGSQN